MTHCNQQLYWVWAAMIQRCTNQHDKAFRNYGARGITVCDRWRRSFDAFISDMGERPVGYTLERIDSDGDYMPDNCRWATRFDQNNNRNWCVYVVIEGERMSLKQAWRKHSTPGLTYRALHKRIINGMPLVPALSTPPRRRQTREVVS